jgi:hypothetical protein
MAAPEWPGGNMTASKLCTITSSDLLTIIEDVGFGKVTIGGADTRGIIIDGYLDLADIAQHINRLIDVRARVKNLIDHAQPR